MEQKFNTHGGYFAPKGFFKVNTGGSHEENPNGGVQVGVDPQGIPNLLEEGEPVYNDYVYSDNIKADKEILEKFNIPSKYAGKLYSKIADAFIDEAEERPNDPISNNGLNAMLVRLANAQEEQKQVQEQAELEKELAGLSPEELSELEAMLAGHEEIEETEPAVDMNTQYATVDPSIMACGGLLHTFQDGGYAARAKKVAEEGQMVQERENEDNKKMREYYDAHGKYLWGRIGSAFKLNSARVAARNAEKDIANLEAWSPYVSKDDLPQYIASLEEAYKTREEAQKTLETVMAKRDSVIASKPKRPDLTKAEVQADDDVEFSFDDAPMVVSSAATKGTGLKSVPTTLQFNFSNGGNVNRFAGGGWEELMNAVNAYTNSRRPGGIAGTYGYGNFDLGDYATVMDLENSDGYEAFTDYVLANPSEPNVQVYLKALDAGTASGVEKLYGTDGNLVSNWADLYTGRRNDGVAGIYHFSGQVPAMVATNAGPTTEVNPDEAELSFGDEPMQDAYSVRRAIAGVGRPEGEDYVREPAGNSRTATRPVYPTWPRYAGALTSGVLGLYNAFQTPDRYTLPSIAPVLPEGRISLVDPAYNPIDENMAVNDVLAASAGTSRSVRNAGLGPSTGAVLVGLDNNISGNVGSARTQVWDANNNRRNAVLGMRNNNAQARAGFYSGLNSQRAGILNARQMNDIRNNLLLQRLNYEAEGQKYAAVGNQIDQVGQALAGIGTENFRLNGSPFDYVRLSDGRIAYIPRENYGSLGGTLMKKYTK